MQITDIKLTESRTLYVNTETLSMFQIFHPNIPLINLVVCIQAQNRLSNEPKGKLLFPPIHIDVLK